MTSVKFRKPFDKALVLSFLLGLFSLILSSCTQGNFPDNSLVGAGVGETYTVSLVEIEAEGATTGIIANISPKTAISGSTATQVDKLTKLRLTSICNGQWQVSNPNPLAVDFKLGSL